MKSEMLSTIVEKSILNEIVEVKETIASGIKLAKPNRRSFGVVDLWNIRRKARIVNR